MWEMFSVADFGGEQKYAWPKDKRRSTIDQSALFPVIFAFPVWGSWLLTEKRLLRSDSLDCLRREMMPIPCIQDKKEINKALHQEIATRQIEPGEGFCAGLREICCFSSMTAQGLKQSADLESTWYHCQRTGQASTYLTGMVDLSIVQVFSKCCYLHEKYGECSCRHPTGLDHQGEISGHWGSDVEGQSHDWEGHSPTSFWRHPCKEKRVQRLKKSLKGYFLCRSGKRMKDERSFFFQQKQKRNSFSQAFFFWESFYRDPQKIQTLESWFWFCNCCEVERYFGQFSVFLHLPEKIAKAKK